MFQSEKFTPEDVADYYNSTLNHYEKWWSLKKALSLHYGIWDEEVRNFTDSLINTNKTLMKHAKIKDSDRILDAGCGVGGAALYLAETKNTKVTGISLSQKQIAFANHQTLKKGLQNEVDFYIMDYTKTTFEDESFDVIWACESISSAPDKLAFIAEASRLLKKGGRLIMSDFFLTNENQIDKNLWMKKWGDTWGISQFVSSDFFEKSLQTAGFIDTQIIDYTDKIQKSAKRMYHSSILGFLPSETYNLFHRKVSRFAKTHYKCGYYQYKALKANLWKYKVISSVKH